MPWTTAFRIRRSSGNVFTTIPRGGTHCPVNDSAVASFCAPSRPRHSLAQGFCRADTSRCGSSRACRYCISRYLMQKVPGSFPLLNEANLACALSFHQPRSLQCRLPCPNRSHSLLGIFGKYVEGAPPTSLSRHAKNLFAPALPSPMVVPRLLGRRDPRVAESWGCP